MATDLHKLQMEFLDLYCTTSTFCEVAQVRHRRPCCKTRCAEAQALNRLARTTCGVMKLPNLARSDRLNLMRRLSINQQACDI